MTPYDRTKGAASATTRFGGYIAFLRERESCRRAGRWVVSRALLSRSSRSKPSRCARRIILAADESSGTPVGRTCGLASPCDSALCRGPRHGFLRLQPVERHVQEPGNVCDVEPRKHVDGLPRARVEYRAHVPTGAERHAVVRSQSGPAHID